MNRSLRSLVWITIGVAAAVTFWPAEALAQRRVVRGRPVVVVRAGYYSPYYYDPFFWDYGGWSPYAQYPPYPPRGYGYGYGYEPGTDVRIQVTPRQAEVYLDGYLTGTVDDFDGMLQRLRVPYGEHEIEIFLDGYQTIRQRMLFRPGESYRIRDALKPLAAGDAAEPRPAPSNPPFGSPPPPTQPDPVGRRGPPRAPARMPPPPPPGAAPVDRGDRAAFGTLSIRVQPVGVEILIDGERWETPDGDARLSVDVIEGTHRIEIRKQGYKTYTSSITLRRGETLPLNVSLPQGQD